VKLEYCPLKVLHRIGLAVGLRDFLELISDGVALLSQAAVALPVSAELAADGMAGLVVFDCIVGADLLVRRACRAVAPLYCVTPRRLSNTS